MNQPFAGTQTLVRLAWRRDRWILPIWIVALGALPASAAGGYESFYPTVAQRVGLTSTIGSNPSIALLYGRAYDLSTAGGFTAWRFGSFVPLLVALMAVFTVTRHTRAEEAAGRAELAASGIVGRLAPLTAGVIVAGAACVAVGAVDAAALMVAGSPAAGSWAFGIGTGLSGLAFVGIAALTAQIAQFSRTANGLGSAAIGFAFLLRAVGDSSSGVGWLSWCSPLGWPQLVRPFTDERWAVLALPVALASATLAAAVLIAAGRDLGAGLLPPRPGPARGRLTGTFGLAWRLQRGALAGWFVGVVIAGSVFGSIATAIGDLVGDSEQAREMFERMGGSQRVADAFLAALAGIYGMVSALYGVQSVTHLRAEEPDRLESLLATRLQRLRWAASHLVVSFGGSALLVTTCGLATGITNGLRVGDVGGSVADMVGATAAQIPAVWLVVAATVVLFGALPRHTSAGWGIAAAALVISLFGPVLQLPQVVLDASPFGHVPKLPSAALTLTPLVILSILTIAAAALGLVAFRRRDIA